MRYGFWAAIVSVTMLGAAAQAETYICSLKADGVDTGWISKTIGFAINDKTGVTLVSDAIILGAYKKPIPAEVVVNTPKRVTIKWEVSGEKDVSNITYTRFMYKLTIFKARGNRVAVSAIPAGNFLPLSSSGKCQLRHE